MAVGVGVGVCVAVGAGVAVGLAVAVICRRTTSYTTVGTGSTVVQVANSRGITYMSDRNIVLLITQKNTLNGRGKFKGVLQIT